MLWFYSVRVSPLQYAYPYNCFEIEISEYLYLGGGLVDLWFGDVPLFKGTHFLQSVVFGTAHCIQRGWF